MKGKVRGQFDVWMRPRCARSHKPELSGYDAIRGDLCASGETERRQGGTRANPRDDSAAAASGDRIDARRSNTGRDDTTYLLRRLLIESGRRQVAGFRVWLRRI